jgi:hypothetical protein
MRAERKVANQVRCSSHMGLLAHAEALPPSLCPFCIRRGHCLYAAPGDVLQQCGFSTAPRATTRGYIRGQC